MKSYKNIAKCKKCNKSVETDAERMACGRCLMSPKEGDFSMKKTYMEVSPNPAYKPKGSKKVVKVEVQEGMKQCRVCGEVKQLEEFPKNSANKKDGRQTRCTPCYTEWKASK